jgi:nucleoside 2-deoxyribosyltransferase
MATSVPAAQGRPRVYLAGPDVFLPDPVAVGERKKRVCDRYGLEGIFPFDAEVPPGDRSRREMGFLISEANERLIRGCAAMIANMTPFRGVSADVGSAYEIGFGRALGLVVFAYTNVAMPFTERTSLALGPGVSRGEEGRLRDSSGMAVEEWDLMDNLMLEGGLRASGGRLVVEAAPEGDVFTDLGAFETCARLLSEILHGPCGAS